MISATGSTASASADRAGPGPGRGDSQAVRKNKAAGTNRQLTPAQQQQVSELQARDREVRAHESAHKAVGGPLTGGVSFSYQTGPDGRQYAVGGDVSIDTGRERDPEATIAKMRQVIAAALAPSQPSAQDRAVASQAQSTLAEAELQVNQRRGGRTEPPPTAPPGYAPPAEPAGGLLDLIA